MSPGETEREKEVSSWENTSDKWIKREKQNEEEKKRSDEREKIPFSEGSFCLCTEKKNDVRGQRETWYFQPFPLHFQKIGYWAEKEIKKCKKETGTENLFWYSHRFFFFLLDSILLWSRREIVFSSKKRRSTKKIEIISSTPKRHQ